MPRPLLGKIPKSSDETSASSHGSKSPSRDVKLFTKGRAALRRFLHLRDSSVPASSIITSTSTLAKGERTFGTGHEVTNGTQHIENDLGAAAEGFSAMSVTLRSTKIAVGAVDNANTAMSDLCAIDATYLAPLSIFYTVVNSIANIHPYAQMALSALTSASQLILSQANLDASIRALLSKVSETYQFIMEEDTLSQLDVMKDTLAQIAQVVQECAQFISKYSETKNFWVRLGKNIFSETSTRIGCYNSALDGLMQRFRDKELRDIQVNVHRMREDLSLEGMSYAGGAGLNTMKTCLDGTRAEILSEIFDWINDTDPACPRVFWLHGQAGKGKSSIAHTIALQAQNLGMLGSCFCFSHVRQAEELHKKLITTIARDLADRDLRLKPLLAEMIANNRSLRDTEDIMQQWQKFILEPVSNLKGPAVGNVVMVVDALDEGGGTATREEILSVFATQAGKLPPNFRILLTSRPLQDIMDTLQSIGHIRATSLEDVSVTSTIRDIRLYVSEKLKRQKGIHQEEVNKIAKKSDGLFEWARLACEYIRSHGAGETAKERFDDLIAHTTEEGRTLLDDMYNLVLEDIIITKQRTLSRFRSVMRQVLYALDPLPIHSLNAMRRSFSGQEGSYQVEVILDYMAPLLSGIIDHSIPVRPLHASLYDFLTEKKRSGQFFIDKCDIHKNLASASLHVMQSSLRFNICGLETSYVRNSAIDGLAAKVEKNISPHLSYSCRFWATHLREAEFDSRLAQSLKEFLDGDRLLFWLEALGLLKSIGEAYRALIATTAWLEGKEDYQDILPVLRDTCKFVCNFASLINESTPHLYLSALPFSPTSSVFAARFLARFPNVAQVATGRHQNWPSSQHVLRGHDLSVESVAFSPDGKRVVSASSDDTIRFWDAEIGTQVGKPLRGHTKPVFAIAFSPDGRRIASGSSDCTIRIWDAENGAPIGDPFRGHFDAVYTLAFSPDGRRIASGSNDNVIRLWDADTGEQADSPLQGHTAAIFSVAFSPDGKRIASGSYDHTIRIWDSERGVQVGSPLRGHTMSVNSIAFSPDGKRIVSGSYDHTIRLWDSETGRKLGTPFTGHIGSVTSVAFLPDGKHVVSGSFDHTIRLWDVGMGTQLGNPLCGHSASVNSVAFSPDGRRLASGSYDDTIRFWDAEAGAQTGKTHSISVSSVAFSPDGKCVVSSSYDDVIRLWDAESGTLVGNPFEGNSFSVKSVTFSPNGKFVAGCFVDAIRVWDVATGMQFGTAFRGHTKSIESIAFSPDGKCIASGSHDHTVRLWDVETGTQLGDAIQGHIKTVYSVVFSPDGSRIASGSSDRTIRLWDTRTGAPIGEPLGGTWSVNSLAFSPDGALIASGYRDHIVRLWDMQAGAQTGNPFQGHTGQVDSVAFSPDGKYVVSGSSDHTIRVWDVEKGIQVGNALRGHTTLVNFVSFSPDGRRILSSSYGDTIRIWEAKCSSYVEGSFHEHTQPFKLDIPLADDDQSRPTNFASDFEEDTPKNQTLIRFSSTPSHALRDARGFFSDLKGDWRELVELQEDGWIVGPRGQLLLWVPLTHHQLLYSPWNTLVMPKGGPELDLSKMAHGRSWHHCFEP